MKARYINPYTDFGFKKLFGEEANKELLIDFLNQLLPMSNVQLKDQYCQTFYNKLTYIFIEMPRFTKKENELENHFEKWLYFLKHLEDFEKIPDILKEEIFIKGFEVAEIANFDEKQLEEYEDSLKKYRDLKGVVDTSFEEGLEEGEKVGLEKGIKKGRTEEKITMAKKLKEKGINIDIISETSGLLKEEIEKL